MRQTCIDARGLERFARLQRPALRAWTIATLLGLLVSAEAAASVRIAVDSLLLRDRIIAPNGSASLAPESSLDSSPTPMPASEAPIPYSEAYWSAVADLNLSGSRNAARNDAESGFAEAMAMLAAGDLDRAETSFTQLTRNSRDHNVAVAAQIMLARTLMYERKWSMLRDLARSSALSEVDKASTEALEQWGRAFANIEPQLIAFPASPVTLPLHVTNVGTPAIRVKINGKEYEFWLDTGSSITVLSTEVAAAAHVPIVAAETLKVRTFAGVARVRPALVRSLKVGSIALTNTPAIVIDASAMRIKTTDGPTRGYAVDGILGWDFIRQFDVVMDFQKNVATFSKPEQLGTAGTAAQNLIWLGEPMVELRSKQGVAVHLSLDTGAQSSFVNATMLKKLGLAARPATGRVYGIAQTAASTGRSIPVLTLSVAGISMRLENVIVYGPTYPSLIGCDGILGSDASQGGVIEIDATNGIFSIG